MKIRAYKLPNGKYKLFLELLLELPVEYSKEDIKILEQNKIIICMDSYYGGTEIEFKLKKELSDDIEASILDAITEKGGANTFED